MQATIRELRREVAELKDLGSGLAPSEWEELRLATARHEIAGSPSTCRRRASGDGAGHEDVALLRAQLLQVCRR